jgi:ABC-type Fe3+/spermidine/putrescine transport system ATPase subunit
VELRDLVKALGITALFVTHDQEEAFDLSDRIAVMKEGRLRQIGSPRRLYEEPEDAFVAGFVGRATALSVRVEEGSVWLGDEVRWPLGPQLGWRGEARLNGRDARLLVRPEDLTIVAGEGDPAVGVPLRGEVHAVRFRGALTFYEVTVGGSGGGLTRGKTLEVAGPVQGPGVGAAIAVQPRTGARLHLFPPGPGE